MERNRIADSESLVSVVVPIYNASKFLEKCLDSIIGQTYRDIEIILVNDGSTDNSLEVAKKYERLDDRVVVIDQKNSGGIIARKNGILKASGKYVLIEDSDDWLEPDLIERCVDVVKKEKDVDIIRFGYISEPSKKEKNLLNDKIIERKILQGKEMDKLIERLIYHDDCNSIWNELIRKDLFDFNDEVFSKIVHKGEDLQINLQIYQKAKKVILMKENLYHYYKNNDGITQSINPSKIVNSVKDNIYLNNVRKRIAIHRFGEVQKDVLINRTMSLLSSKIIKILAFSKTAKKDVGFLQKELVEDMNKYLVDFDKQDLKQRKLNKLICRNVIDNEYLKNLRYSFLCKFLVKVKMVK